MEDVRFSGIRKLAEVWAVCLLVFTTIMVKAQSNEAQQLLLNYEKLTQFKNILSEMKRGYDVISSGYNAIRDIANGNFSLHQTFLDGMLQVTPVVQSYGGVAGIISDQARIVSEYKGALSSFRKSGNFSSQELDYLARVYGKLLDNSLKNLDELMTVITTGSLRMSDDERLQAIDRISADVQDKLQFLRSFNNEASLLSLQRSREKNDIVHLRNLYK